MSDPRPDLVIPVGGPSSLPGMAASSPGRMPFDDPTQGLPAPGEAFILNRYAGKEVLTPLEAVDCINYLSGALLIDGRKRNGNS